MRRAVRWLQRNCDLSKVFQSLSTGTVGTILFSLQCHSLKASDTWVLAHPLTAKTTPLFNSQIAQSTVFLLLILHLNFDRPQTALLEVFYIPQ